MTKIRILVSGYTYNFGGTERTMDNIFSILGANKYVFDFIVAKGTPQITNYDLHRSNGSIIYPINLKRKGRFISYRNETHDFFKKNAKKYDAIIVNLGEISDALFLKYSKKYGIKKRIIYAHMGCYKRNIVGKLSDYINKHLIHRYANYFFASSKLAANCSFLKKDVKKTKLFMSIGNTKISYDKNERNKIRKQFGIKNDDIVIGFVASINKTKNQKYLVEVCNEVMRISKHKVKVFIVGGSTDDQYFKELEGAITSVPLLSKNYFLLGSQKNINSFYSAFDVYFSSSLSESLGQSILEAYLSGLPILLLQGSVISKIQEMCNAIELPRNNVIISAQIVSKCISKINYNRATRVLDLASLSSGNLIKILKD